MPHLSSRGGADDRWARCCFSGREMDGTVSVRPAGCVSSNSLGRQRLLQAKPIWLGIYNSQDIVPKRKHENTKSTVHLNKLMNWLTFGREFRFWGGKKLNDLQVSLCSMCFTPIWSSPHKSSSSSGRGSNSRYRMSPPVRPGDANNHVVWPPDLSAQKMTSNVQKIEIPSP